MNTAALDQDKVCVTFACLVAFPFPLPTDAFSISSDHQSDSDSSLFMIDWFHISNNSELKS